MEFLYILIILFIISFLGAAWSLRHELSKPKELKKVKKELIREKVLFKK